MDTRHAPVEPAWDCATLNECLDLRARNWPEALAYRYLGRGDTDGPVTEWTWSELNRRADAVAAAVSQVARPGERALLLFAPGLDFIAGFFGCLRAGVVAVPVPPPDPARLQATLPRLLAIIADAAPGAVLSTRMIAAMGRSLDADVAALPWLHVDEIANAATLGASAQVSVSAEDLAFLQYTSGSTGTPKGVCITHRNLMVNLAMIERGYAVARPGMVGQAVSWLPCFHDMGLIGIVLGTAFIGGGATLLSPLDFLKRPARWLEAISAAGRPVMSAAPDFAYAYAARRCPPEVIETLDLSHWHWALCGAEPVHADTLARFARTFAPAGFDPAAFRPSYGLAEATLFVSASGRDRACDVLTVATDALQWGEIERRGATRGILGQPDGDPSTTETSRPYVSCGTGDQVQSLRIVKPGEHRPLPEHTVGEILVAGPHVSAGYWQKPGHPDFAGSVAGDGRSYLRTGDLGFISAGALYITGRIKDLIIVRGRNLYPNDLEAVCAGVHPAIRAGGVAAFGYRRDGIEAIATMVEVTLQDAPPEAVAAAVRGAIAANFAAEVDAVVLVPPRTLLRTSSGKLRRVECRDLWQRADVEFIAEVILPRPTDLADIADIVNVADAADASDVWASIPAPREATAGNAAAPTKRTARELTAWLQAWIQERVRPGPVRPSESFTSAGLDSLNLVWLASDLEKLLGFEVPVQSLHGGTVKTTAALLAMGHRQLTDERPLDLVREAHLDEQIRPTIARSIDSNENPSPRAIFVTGATGALGSYLTASLLRRTSAPLVCLARARDDSAARQRVLDALAPFDCDESALERVRGLAGDLSRPALGLESSNSGPGALAALGQSLRAIYHCGAEIDWLKPYSSLAPTNVGGTREVLKLACLRSIPVHYVSTVGVYPFAEDVTVPFPEDAPLGDSDKLQLGYFQSKWVAEKLIEQARTRGLPVTVYRPSLVAGDSRTGRQDRPEHQLLWAFQAGCVQLGAVPAVTKVIDAVPVDWLADAIVAISLLPAARGCRLNFKNPSPLAQRDWYNLLRARGYELREIAYPRWRERILGDLDSSNPLARFSIYYKVMDEGRMQRLQDQMSDSLPVGDSRTRELLAAVGSSCPPLDERLVTTYLDYYVGQALLPRPEVERDANHGPSPAGDRMSGPALYLPDPFAAREPRVASLYDKATRRQWRAFDRIDWSIDLDPENPIDLPDAALPLYGSPMFEKLDARGRARVRTHYQAWQLSQFLYGEQTALPGAGQLIRMAPTAEMRAFAATQAVDEARHVELYTRLLDEKFGIHYPMADPLRRLAESTWSDSRWDITALSMQILVEGLALSSFASMRDQSRNPLVVSIHAYVMEDEARHVGFGHRVLKSYYQKLSDRERQEREELIIEASYLLRDRLIASDEVWDACGLDGRACTRWIRESGYQRAWASRLFARIVPAIRAIGLWSVEVQNAYSRMGLLGFAGHELDRLRADDDRRAQEVESARA